MKRIVLLLVTILLFSVLLTACTNPFDGFDTTEIYTVPPEPTTEEVQTEKSDRSTTGSENEENTTAEETVTSEKSVSETSVAETTVAPTQSAETTTASNTASDSGTAKTAMKTSKGYEIVENNGITYVNGILIANKTYSLPSSYNPGSLLSECYSAFEKMRKDADYQGLTLYLSSGFRSYSTQENIYNRYCAEDGVANADRYSARPGHSEHQTGLAIDLNTITYSFADTAEGKWVAEHCWEYGFILRYPENKEAQTGYRYEPWHIRYVGENMADKIYHSGLCLEEYLGISSVYGNTAANDAVSNTVASGSLG